MKHAPLLTLLLLLALPASADNDNPAVAGLLDGARELGQSNGIALACGYTELSSKARAMMILRAPKTRRFGEAFEDASSAAFNKQSISGEACPEAVVLALKLEMTELRMQDLAAKAAGK